MQLSDPQAHIDLQAVGVAVDVTVLLLLRVTSRLLS
jgi:hypothetical protein